MEQKTRVFCQIDVQEFHLWFMTLDVSTVNKLPVTYAAKNVLVIHCSLLKKKQCCVPYPDYFFQAFQFGTNGSK